MFIKSKSLILILILIFGISMSGCVSGDGSYTEEVPYTAYEDVQVPLKYDVTNGIKSTTLKGFDAKK